MLFLFVEKRGANNVKHKSDLLWCFLLPAFAEGAEEWLADPASMVQLENALVEGDIDDLTTIIVENKESTHEKR